jgi:ATP-binding cassette subfamily B protein RaxB
MFRLAGSETPQIELFRSKKLPIILQAEAAECGLACLAMVAGHHGHNASLSEFRRRFSTSLKGATLRSVMDMADSLGFSARPLRLEMEEITQLKCPAILHWDLKHFVVLERIRGGKAYIHDPARGACQLPLDAVSKHFTGVALELTASDAFGKKAAAERVNLSDLFGRVRGIKLPLLQLFSLAAVTQVFALLSPVLNQLVVDSAISRGDLDLLTTIALGMGLLLLVNIGTSILKGFVNLYLGTQLSFQLQTNLLRHTMRLSPSWFEKRHVGDILSRFSSLAPVQSFFTSSAISIVLDGLMATTSLVMMVLYAPLLTVLEIASLAVSIVVRLLSFPYVRQKTDQGLHLSAKVQTIFLETIRGARTFKLFGAERERVAAWQNEQANAINNSVQLARFSIWGASGAGMLTGVQQIIIWFLGARMVIEGKMTLGMLMAYQAFAGQFVGSVGGLIGQLFSFKTMNIHLDRLADIIHAPIDDGIDEPIDYSEAPKGDLRLHGVNFRYAEHEPWIVRNTSLHIKSGEFACLVGPSGGGKTTLLKLMMGFNVPQDGEILVDGSLLKSFGIRNFRQNIGVVMQDDQLFAGTIADNISFFDSDADQTLIEHVARQAQIHDEIIKFPMGYLTLVGDMGTTLSGGQRQRIFLARALYRKPRILFLDEGTANLDPENEDKVMNVIRSLEITRIVVAHRASAVRGCDRTILVRDGSVTDLDHGLSKEPSSGVSDACAASDV